MRQSRHNRGFTLIEVLTVTLITTILGAGLWTLIRTAYDSQFTVLGQNTANTSARSAVDELADNLRGTRGLTSASANEVTFTDNNNGSIRYWVSDGKLLKSSNATTAETVALDVQSLSLTYWTKGSSGWTSSSSPSLPSMVGAVDFTVTGSSNECTRRVSGSVRIRQK